jgi:glycosyltransferase involved in cell wall biosynthesis
MRCYGHTRDDEGIPVDDASEDATAAIARPLGLRTIVPERNFGHGGNQKTCYCEALRAGACADIVIMLHPDDKDSPKLPGAMAQMIVSGHYDLALGSNLRRSVVYGLAVIRCAVMHTRWGRRAR